MGDQITNETIPVNTDETITGDSSTTSSTEVTNPEVIISRDDFKGLSKFIGKEDTKNNSVTATDTPSTPVVDAATGVSSTTEEAEQPAPAIDSPTSGDDTNDKVEDENQDPMESVPIKELTALRKGNMLQADYTRKTQELAEERKKFQQELDLFNQYKDLPVQDALSLWDSLAMDPIGTIRFLEEHYVEQGLTEPKDPEVLKIEKALLEEQQRNKILESQLQENTKVGNRVEFDQYMASLSAKYKDDGFDAEEVLKFCMEHEIPNPEIAFKAIQHERLVIKNQELTKQLEEKGKTAVSEYVKEKATEVSSFIPPVGTGNTSSGITVSKPKTFAEAKKAALARNFG